MSLDIEFIFNELNLTYMNVLYIRIGSSSTTEILNLPEISGLKVTSSSLKGI